MSKMKYFIFSLVFLLSVCYSCSLKQTRPNKTLITDSDKSFYGKYKKPKLLQDLKLAQDEGLELEFGLHFFIKNKMPYSITPIDVIPFAGTGYNGAHFGFLTDFGHIDDLSHAPIVVVCPTYDPPVQLIAENLQEFLNVVATIKDATYLCDVYNSDEDFIQRLHEYDIEMSKNTYLDSLSPEEEKEIIDENIARRKEVIDTLRKNFGVNPKANLTEYLSQIRLERAKEYTIQDQYRLGLKVDCVNAEISVYQKNRKSLSEVSTFLKQANKCERIQFYRNATSSYILANNYHSDIRDLLIIYLEKDGFHREARILREEY